MSIVRKIEMLTLNLVVKVVSTFIALVGGVLLGLIGAISAFLMLKIVFNLLLFLYMLSSHDNFTEIDWSQMGKEFLVAFVLGLLFHLIVPDDFFD